MLLIDFWYTGCGACMGFHKNFHQRGYPLIKDNKDFVYVSVSIDKQKKTWLKSVANGDYSSNDYLNLNTELGVSDPFLKYYERNAMPFLILVDKNGKIYSSRIIPEPKAVVQLINEALNIPYQL
ncbi:Thioredoxin-like protein [compost metagenome]